MFYFTLFLLFVYFKIARIHRKEEKVTPLIVVQHLLIALCGIAIYIYGFTHLEWYSVVALSVVYFIVAALMITAIQLGIFIDGKPQFGISKVYKLLPVLTLITLLSTLSLWL